MWDASVLALALASIAGQWPQSMAKMAGIVGKWPGSVGSGQGWWEVAHPWYQVHLLFCRALYRLPAINSVTS